MCPVKVRTNRYFLPDWDVFINLNYVIQDDEADSQTEGEELDKARKERMQEVNLKPLPYLQTDTETEVKFEKT